MIVEKFLAISSGCAGCYYSRSRGPENAPAREERASALQPAATHRKHLADEAVGGRTAQIGSEFGALAGADHAAEWHLRLQPFLKAWVGLPFRREVGRVVEEVERDGHRPGRCAAPVPHPQIAPRPAAHHAPSSRLKSDSAHATPWRCSSLRNLPERRAIIAGSSARAKRGKGSTIAAKVARQPSSPTSAAGATSTGMAKLATKISTVPAARTTRSAASGADKGDSSASTIAPCSASTSHRAGPMKSRACVISTRLPSSRLFIARSMFDSATGPALRSQLCKVSPNTPRFVSGRRRARARGCFKRGPLVAGAAPDRRVARGRQVPLAGSGRTRPSAVRRVNANHRLR